VVVTVNDEKVTLVDLKSGEQTTPFDDSSPDSAAEAVTCFCLHPKGDDIVVATQKFFLKHWQLSSKTCVRTIRAHQMPILTMTYDSTGTLVATGSADRSVRVFDIGRGYCTHSFKEHTDIVQTVRFHPDPNRLQLFSTSDDNTIRIYDLIDNKCIAVFREHVSTPTAVSLTPDGYFMASSGRDKVRRPHSFS
jgi:U3 small nucleolar RNA-associated protein 13